MSGPTTLLARTIDKSRLKPWRCPLWKCEVAAMSLGDGCRISIGRSLGSQDNRIMMPFSLHYSFCLSGRLGASGRLCNTAANALAVPYTNGFEALVKIKEKTKCKCT